MADGEAAADREMTPEAGEKEAGESERIQQVLEEVLVAAGLERLVLSGDPEKQSDEGAPQSTEPGEESKPVVEKREEGAVSRPLNDILLPRPVTEFVDITAVFSEAASHLSPGELVQEDNFSLFDAMSAIELMDIKMDAALQWNNFLEYPRTIHEAVERGLLKLDGHSPDELVGITDEVIACVATWLEGHTLAQTVFTCLYLLDTAAICTLSLRAFSQAVVKCVEFMRDGICRGAVYSDDDQQGVCFGFDMLKMISDSSVATALREAEERTQNLLKHVSPGPSSSRTIESSAAPGSAAPGSVAPGKVVDSKVLKALLHRIRFIRSLFTFVCSIRKGTSQGIENALQKVSHCLSLVDPILASMELGSKLDPSNPLALGFHPVINQRLLPPSYKQYQIVSRPEGMRILREVLGQVKTALGFGRIDSFMELRCAIVNFCSEGKSPNVFARSLIVSHCIQSDRQKLFGSSPPEALLKDDVRAFINPSSLNPRSPVSTFAKELIDAFFIKASIPMIDLLRTYCHHRARQRQKIVRCLDALGEIQQEYERMDQQLNSLTRTMDPQRQHLGCFSTWLLYHLVILMIEYVVLGFEYNLYSPFELHYTYWYLEYLYGWFFTTMKSAEKLFLSERALPGKGKRKAKKREFSKEKEREAAIAQAKRMACIGTMRALEALLLDNKVPQPTFEFGSQEFCFQHRFLSFSSIATPQLLSYADYVRLAGIDNYKGRDVNLYDAAAKHFVSARTAVENVHRLDSEMEALLKVVKTNTVIMNLAAKGHKKGSQVPPSMDFSLHRHFPVIRIN